MDLHALILLATASSLPEVADSSSPTTESIVLELFADILDVKVEIGGAGQSNPSPPTSPTPTPCEGKETLGETAPTWSPRFTGGRWEGGIAFELGRFGINHVGGIQVGLRAHIGRQFGPVRLAVEGTFAKFSDLDDSPRHESFGGELHRLGLGLRYRATAESEDVGLSGYLEVGAGRQRILWNGGGETLDRSDVMIGFGYEVVGGRGGFGGMDMGVRFLASPTTNRGTPGCIQICATTSIDADQTRDLGVMFVLGTVFGS